MINGTFLSHKTQAFFFLNRHSVNMVRLRMKKKHSTKYIFSKLEKLLWKFVTIQKSRKNHITKPYTPITYSLKTF